MIKIICFSIILVCNIAMLIRNIIRYCAWDKMHKDILEERQKKLIEVLASVQPQESEDKE